MLLKTGQLARRTGITVRTLHHYHAIGLLTPSARSDAGYRLYNQSDIARLHQIQVLRKLSLSLTDIGAFLAKPDASFESVLCQQIAMLTQQIEQANTLRARLGNLQTQLATGEAPDLAHCLTTLELMTMYDKYFSPNDLQRLPLYQPSTSIRADWQILVAEAQSLLDRGVAPSDARAQALAEKWMSTLERDTMDDPGLAHNLDRMHTLEPVAQGESGISPAMRQFIITAASESKMALYRRYLSDEEYEFLRQNYSKRNEEWPPLIAQVRAAMRAGVAPGSLQAQRLALTWFDLFRSYASDKPETQQKFRQAHEGEPRLMAGTWVDQAMLDYITAAILTLKPR